VELEVKALWEIPQLPDMDPVVPGQIRDVLVMLSFQEVAEAPVLLMEVVVAEVAPETLQAATLLPQIQIQEPQLPTEVVMEWWVHPIPTLNLEVMGFLQEGAEAARELPAL
jgi:hypothetical protein